MDGFQEGSPALKRKVEIDANFGTQTPSPRICSESFRSWTTSRIPAYVLYLDSAEQNVSLSIGSNVYNFYTEHSKILIRILHTQLHLSDCINLILRCYTRANVAKGD